MQQSNYISFSTPTSNNNNSSAPSNATTTAGQTQFRSLNCEVLRTKIDPSSSSTNDQQQPQQQIHALFNLTQPVTVRAPCAVIGLTGHCLVQGFHLRQRALLIDEAPNVHIAVQPLPRESQRDGRPNKGLESAISAWGPCSASGATLNHLRTGAPLVSSTSVAIDLDSLHQVEERFGKINWAWIRQTMSDISQKSGAGSGHNAQHNLNDHVLVLIIAHDQQQQQQQQQSTGGFGEPPQQQQQGRSDDYLPFFAPRMAPVPHYILQDTLLPALAEAQSARPPTVLVAGAVNTGKSTTCRFICNNLLSLHGECIWVDLDLGQSEFSVPGGIGAFRLTQPLFSPNQTRGATVERIAFHFLGAPTMRDPVAMSLALESVCNSAIVAAAKKDKKNNNNSRVGAGGRRRRGLGGGGESDDEDEQQQQQQQQRVPIIINTHGWVLSTGRRATLEVLQRLRPNQVVHLVAPNGADDSRWLLPSSASSSSSSSSSTDPSCSTEASAGLSSAVVEHRFRAPTLASMPLAHHESSAAAPAWGYMLHRVNLEKLFDKDAAENRQRQWCRYFSSRSNASIDMVASLLGGGAGAGGGGGYDEDDDEGNISETRVPLGLIRLVYAEEDAMPWCLRGRRTRLQLSSSSSSGGNNNNNERSLLTEIRETVHCGLVGVSLQQQSSGEEGNLSSASSSLVVEQLNSIPSREVPNISGFCLAIMPEAQQKQQGSEETTAAVSLVGPRALVQAIQRRSGGRVGLVLGWQQFDAAWNQQMVQRFVSSRM